MGSDDINKRRITKNRKARQSRKDARKTQVRSSIPRILIVTEGRSEEIYFNLLKRFLKLNTLEVEKSNHTDSIGIINEAEKYGLKAIESKNEFNYIFCIFDLDTVRNKVFINLINAYNQKYKKEGSIIYPIFTYPCIEFWFILHYKDHSAPFTNKRSHSIGDIVKAEFKKYHGDYHETNEKSITQLISIYKTAIDNAKIIMDQQLKSNSSNPVTNIHQLVILLDNIYYRNSDSEYRYNMDVDFHIVSNI